MKKFLVVLTAAAVLAAGSAQAFPRQRGRHFRPAAVSSVYHPKFVKNHHRRKGAVLAAAGTLLGVAAVTNLLMPQSVHTVQSHVPSYQPVTTSNCTTTVNNGMTVQQCVITGY